MERNYYTEGFESFLKEKTDEYKLYPSEKVWNNINRKLHPRRKWAFLAAALLILGIGVGSKYALDDWNQSPLTSLENKSVPADIYDELNKPATSKTEENAGTFQKRTNTVPKPRLAAVNHMAEPAFLARQESSLIAVPPSNTIDAQDQPVDTIEQADMAFNHSLTNHGEFQSLAQAKIVPLAKSIPVELKVAESQKENPISAKLDEILTTIGKARKKTMWQLYASPTASYRKLIGKASTANYNYSGLAYSANLGFPSDVNDAVTHKPSIGVEIGTALIYPVSKNFRLKAGLQFNFNNYNVEAYSYAPEMAPFGGNGPGNFGQPINTVAYYRNFSGFDKTWLRNSHFMISVPLGVEITVVGNSKVSFNIASTIQPTYVINNQAYLVSTNLKNYAQEPSLYRKWNVNTGAEAFMSINTGTFKWVIGPQFRYQLLSSYKDKYPIKEHLIDFGFKVGVNKTLK
jgi:hypothetical protein